jgi:hypothetical protein
MEGGEQIDPDQKSKKGIIKNSVNVNNLEPLAQEYPPQFVIGVGHPMRRIFPKLSWVQDIGRCQDQLPSPIQEDMDLL